MDIEQYEAMAEAFGADFESEDNMPESHKAKSKDEIQEELNQKIQNDALVEENTTELMKIEKEEVETVRIQDEQYIQNEYRMGIEMLNDVAEVLRGDLNQGSRASSFDAFSSLMRERREYINSLETANTKIYERNNKAEGPEFNAITGQNITNNMVFTSEDALDLILKARDGLDPSKEIK
jgi:hypothetical protein